MKLMTTRWTMFNEAGSTTLLEQYKLLVSSALSMTERRNATNSFMLAMNSTLASVFGFWLAHAGEERWCVIVPVCGVATSVLWLLAIEAYRRLNSAKFKVINELEEYLPARAFGREWWHCEQANYPELSRLEKWIPIVFGLLHIVLIVYALCINA